MSVYEVKKYPSPVLRKVSRPVKHVGRDEQELLEYMMQTMYQNKGIGLAAPQIGIDQCLAVVDTGNGPMKLVNPRIVKRHRYDTLEEGCLSIPGANVKVKRAKKILIKYTNEKNEAGTLEADGLLARAIQHEIDHLNGRLIIDYLNPVKRFFLKRRLKCL